MNSHRTFIVLSTSLASFANFVCTGRLLRQIIFNCICFPNQFKPVVKESNYLKCDVLCSKKCFHSFTYNYQQVILENCYYGDISILLLQDSHFEVTPSRKNFQMVFRCFPLSSYQSYDEKIESVNFLGNKQFIYYFNRIQRIFVRSMVYDIQFFKVDIMDLQQDQTRRSSFLLVFPARKYTELANCVRIWKFLGATLHFHNTYECNQFSPFSWVFSSRVFRICHFIFSATITECVARIKRLRLVFTFDEVGIRKHNNYKL